MRAVLLDLDGTLVDSLPGITAGINEVLGLRLTPEGMRPRVGPPSEETFARLTGRPAAEIGPLVERYRARYRELMLDGTHVFPGVPELLDELRAAGFTLAVATSKARPLARELLAGLGLAEAFAAIEGPVPPSGDGKAQTIGAALRALGLAPAGAGRETAMVGDRRHDVEGALAHGLTAVGALWGFGDAEELRGAGAHALAATPADVADAVRAGTTAG